MTLSKILFYKVVMWLLCHRDNYLMCFRQLFLVVIVFMFLTKAHSAQWILEPDAIIRTEYDDNIYLREDNKIDVRAVSVTPGLLLEGKDDRWNLKLDSRFRSTKYTGIEDADNNNVFVDFITGYRMERSSIGIAVNFKKNTTFDREFDTILQQAGLIELRVKKADFVIEPYWNWKTSEKTSVALNYKATKIDYSENAPVQFSDNRNNELKATLQWDQSENMNFGLVMKKIESEVIDFDYDNEQDLMQLFVNYDISEISSITALLGKSKVKYTYHNIPECVGYVDRFFGCISNVYILVDRESETTVDDFNFAYNYIGEINEIDISAYRRVNSSSFGSATQTDVFTIDYKRRLSQRSTMTILLSQNDSEALDGLDSNQDGRTIQIRPAITWRMSEYWNFSIDYRYIKRDLAIADAQGVSNSIAMNLYMKWP